LFASFVFQRDATFAANMSLQMLPNTPKGIYEFIDNPDNAAVVSEIDAVR
jgi:hypothetical protein